ncbi:hypothetical protein [Rossellomorea vietnamensis]|uniref:hypothetical protein n=1 Tax=Rossellomorea vietnamensis TaxID=218284 RepID=UPI001653CA89|nr:hypothetical protein [Rossellomorea vietnamensis]
MYPEPAYRYMSDRKRVEICIKYDYYIRKLIGELISDKETLLATELVKGIYIQAKNTN